MSEIISDSPEPGRSDAPCDRVCKNARGVEVVYPFLTSESNWPAVVCGMGECHQTGFLNMELLFDNNTCLMAAWKKAEAQRVPVMGGAQTEWGRPGGFPNFVKLFI